MNKFSKKTLLSFFTSVLSISMICCFSSCQKAAVNPYSNPAVATTSTIDPPTFAAAVNNSITASSFTPSKNISGNNTTLKGTSTYYTITITFPSSTGTGHYNIGITSGFTAVLYTGSDTYYVNSSNGLGTLDIASISTDGKYTGTFNFTGWDSSNNYMTVNQGSFSNL
jgi:hypothetical protein